VAQARSAVSARTRPGSASPGSCPARRPTRWRPPRPASPSRPPGTSAASPSGHGPALACSPRGRCRAAHRRAAAAAAWRL